MVQQFLHIQLKNQSSQFRRDLALNVSQGLSQNLYTIYSIVQWERFWVEDRKIPKRKDRNDRDLWIYDKDVNNAIKEFARV